jgi:CIC family chloride channel protein
MLLPAMFAAAASYVVFAAINGTRPLFPVAGAPPFDLRDIGGAALVGLGCGLGARAFAALLKHAKRLADDPHRVLRVALGSSSIALFFVCGRLLTGESIMLGSGYEAIEWALRPNHAIALVLAIFALRAGATVVAVGCGAVGGLFIPLVVQGALLGSAVGIAVGAPSRTLFPVLGVAAFLGAGYRVPLAAIMFVAESTGRPGFIVPGLIAAASSQLFMGRSSVSAYQLDTRDQVIDASDGSHALERPDQ